MRVGKRCGAHEGSVEAVTGGSEHDAARAKDADLLAAYVAGDQSVARQLTRAHAPRIFGHAVRVLGDAAEAEDVTQDALMRLWKIAPDWDAGRAQISTWLFRVTANLCTDRLRARRSVPLDDVDEPADTTLGAEAQLQQAARMGALKIALNSLPDRQRQAVVLRHLDGLANPQIAQILEIGVEAVESLTARGKRALTAALAAQRPALGYDDDTT
ncbi:RNA polymerase subunit sigma [Sulfitobacter sp. SK012]|uniref:RNA polymerase sigma factor n=1 Tax=Sulfitobacter sp. SK012 TaxID=1389005 RepID=UPI000E0A84DB|nr:RNA polymerase sigma factor [Sulfitobacter sp. SK012]AXI48807.1 RNA polymerase subunit sigma [Sulfitobacter sp. SK012]